MRIDTWVETGTEVTPFYDSLLGKLMVHGKDRPDAVAKMAKALSGTVLGGIPSNLEYLSTIIASEGFHAGALLSVLEFQFEIEVVNSDLIFGFGVSAVAAGP